MLCSFDGKISTGNSDERDFDKDFPRVNGIKEGLSQYYELEKKTDIHSFNTGKVFAKIGINKVQKIEKMLVSFIIVDNNHLSSVGVDNLIQRSKRLYLVTSNKNHPAFHRKEQLELIYYPKRVDFSNLFQRLKRKYDIKSVTIQSGGTMNSMLLRKNLIDRLSIVIAPCVVGGKDTPTLVDGDSLCSIGDLKKIKNLRLLKMEKLRRSYIHLVYEVL
jgi:2,5-diamino-6-(ribosylamino)-4(3H)-pyrimidinone 5'-phosphate reductase